MSDLFGVRKRGEEGVYFEGRDFLYLMPELLVKGAAFASDPKSDINIRLEARHPGGTVKIKDHLSYLLDVLHECRREDLSVVFDDSRVEPDVYHAIMEGVGAMTLRRFNRLFREYTFTSMTGQRDEPIKYVDKEAAMLLYSNLTGGH
jgi:hypothetical protein